MAISGRRATSPASASGSSLGLSQTPTSSRAARAECSDCHSASGTITGVLAGTFAREAASRSSGQRSSTIARPLMSSGIDALLEGLDTQTAHGVDEALVLVAFFHVDIDQAGDDVRHFLRGEGGPYHLAQGRGLGLIAADRDLVPLLAILIDAEHADIADVVVPARVHATGNVEIELADVIQVIEVVEAPLYRFRDRDRLGVRKRAEIPAGAADDVGQEAYVRRRESQCLELAPQRRQFLLPDVAENEVLLVRDAELSEAVGIGQVRNRVHLVGCRIAWRHAGLLERKRHHGVAGHLVREDVALDPVAEPAVVRDR